jgi:hypothetical protein
MRWLVDSITNILLAPVALVLLYLDRRRSRARFR